MLANRTRSCIARSDTRQLACCGCAQESWNVVVAACATLHGAPRTPVLRKNDTRRPRLRASDTGPRQDPFETVVLVLLTTGTPGGSRAAG